MLVKLASTPPVMDQYDDGGRLFLAELGEAPVPEIVKTAADMSSVTKYPEDFALTARTNNGTIYKYPILDPGNAVVSAVYFDKTAQYLPVSVRADAAKKIVEALQEYGIVPPANVVAMQGEQEKLASFDDHLSVLLPTNIGYADQLLEQFSSLSPMGKRQAAMFIKEAGMRLPAEMAPYAANEVGSDFAMAVDARKRYVSEDVALAMDHLKKVAGVVPDQLAQELYEIDVELGLTRYYGRIPDPYQSVFGTELAKVAFAPRDSVSIEGRDYSADKVRSVSDKVAEVFGKNTADELAANPVDVLESLPMPHKMAIARMMDAAA